MSKRANREGKTNILPFIEYCDENNQSYYIDECSKPWFYLFLNFRIYFPVNAFLIDKKMTNNSIGKKRAENKNIGIYGGIGIGKLVY